MVPDKRASERGRTTKQRGDRVPPTPTDLEVFQEHDHRTLEFSRTLKEERCLRTHHFDERLSETLASLKALFAPWNMEILFLLYMRDAQRFNQLKRALGGISSRVLTDKLTHLTSNGLVDREETQGGGRVDYELTEHGLVVARYLHPLVFYLNNRAELPELPS